MLELRLAYRNILRQKRRSLLTGISMAGGFALCTFSFCLLEGGWGNAVDIFTLDHTGHIQIHWNDYHRRPKIHKTIDEREAIEQILTNHQEITAFAPRVYAPALAYANNQTRAVRVVGVDWKLEPTTSRLREKVHAGEYLDNAMTSDGYAKAMIGAGVANTLDIGIGDELVLISQGADGSVANDIVMITALVGTRTSWDKMNVYLPLPAAQSFLSMGNRVHEYALQVADSNANEDIARSLQTEINHINPAITVSTWQVVEESFYRTMQSDKQGNYFTMALIVFLVFIGVLNTVLMSILERTREFGVIRAIGSRPIAIIRLIFLETIILATLSIAAGVVIVTPALYWLLSTGFTLPTPIEFGGVTFDHMTGRLSLFVLTVPALLIYVFAALVSILPGIRAARITPQQAMASH